MKKGLLTAVVLGTVIMAGCGKAPEESSISENKKATEAATMAPTEGTTQRHVKLSNNVVYAVWDAAYEYYGNDLPEDEVIYGTVGDKGVLDDYILEQSEKLIGLGYVIVTDSRGNINTVFCGYSDGGMVSRGVINDLAYLGVESWDELVAYYTDPTYERKELPVETKTFTPDELRGWSGEIAYSAELDVTADSYALDKVNIRVADENILLSPSMVGWLGGVYEIAWDLPVKEAELRFTFDPKAMESCNIYTADEIEPVMYRFTYEDQILTEVEGQGRSGNTIRAKLDPDKTGYYMLLHKPAVDELYNNDILYDGEW